MVILPRSVKASPNDGELHSEFELGFFPWARGEAHLRTLELGFFLTGPAVEHICVRLSWDFFPGPAVKHICAPICRLKKFTKSARRFVD